MKGKLIRLRQDKDIQTLGRFYLFNDLDEVFSCVSLELGDKQNQNSISRINAGTYNCKLRWSSKYQWHYILENVEGRSYILIHFGNYYKDTRGCIILGNSFADIDKDGYTDVTSSKKTIKKLLSISSSEFELTIIDE